MATLPELNHSDDATITTFGPPFDDTNADVILRSSDRVDFLVYEVILSKASPVFKTMFSLPQPATDAHHTPQDSRPIVVLAEHGRVVAALLLTIYPPTLVSAGAGPLSLNDHIAVLDMARKYDMAATSRRLLVDFEGSEALRNDHLQAFCAAYGCELPEAAKIAAKASLKHPFTLDAIGDDLQYINGPAFHTLWKFHRACSTAAVKAISGHTYTWIPNIWWSSSSVRCRCSKIGLSLGPTLSYWATNASWGKYVDRAVKALKTHPCSEAITDRAILLPSYQVPQAEMCGECGRQIAGLSEFSRYLGEEVDRVSPT